MKAIICTKYGPPEVLQIQEVEKPTPKDNEILVKVHATAVNSGDVRVRGLVVTGIMRIVMRLVLGFSKPRKSIIGTVYSGIVDSTGTKISQFKKGDKVFGSTGFNFGTYAEYLVVKETDPICPMPKNATYEDAAAILFGGQTATYFLKKAGLTKESKSKVLIIGGTGAVGTSAIQIAQSYGADVTVVCSTAGKSLVESLGVTKIVCYDKEDYTNTSEKFNIIFDAVGKSTKKQCEKLLATDGIYKSVEGLEVSSETKEQIQQLKELFEAGKLKAVIDKVFAFEQVVEAHKYVDTGKKKGNVVLKVQ